MIVGIDVLDILVIHFKSSKYIIIIEIKFNRKWLY